MSTPYARACPACTETRSSTVGEAGGFGLARCNACGTLFTATLPTLTASLNYDDYYHEGNLAVPDFVHRRLDELVERFADRRQTGRWLDVGCGAGALLHAAKRAGWRATGTEVSAGAAAAVAATGVEVLVGELRELDLRTGAYDVVSLVEVVEHVPDPRGLLSEAAALLRPGGVLYVTTPHGRGVSARMLGPRWSVVAPPEHLQLFSLAGLRRAVGDAGLRVEAASSHGVNPSELVHGLRRSRSPVQATARVETGYRLNEALTSSRRGALVKWVANGLLARTRLGDSIRLVAARPV